MRGQRVRAGFCDEITKFRGPEQVKTLEGAMIAIKQGEREQ
jgi:hypothetical protein